MVSAALGVAVAGSLAFSGTAGTAGTASAAPKAPADLQSDRVIDRAHTWTDKRVPYSQARHKDGYRTDCSGFVAMAWDIPENVVTWNIPLIAKRIGKNDLRPGDVLLNASGGAGGRHVVLFEKWANDAHTEYWALEQNGGTDDAVRRVMPYPYKFDRELYKPYRYTGMDRYYDELGDSGLQPVPGWEKRKAAEEAVKAKAAAKAKADERSAAKAKADRTASAVAAAAGTDANDLRRAIRRGLAPGQKPAAEERPVPQGALVVTMLRVLGM